MALLLTLRDGERKIVNLPPESRPEDIAERHGAQFFDVCLSLEEAKRRLSEDPNGKVSSY